ncbi:hypothetical protein CDAR_485751 [Caerostris darwini]|uniref:Uncharacterized protein n=1 Tax=Caerostris darwini TaxID=1538125 RepID=A0AAV4WJD2_9ARAC|nr:hypothetical protein CDAR_485751 [Caerostris darwini]
MRSRNSRSPRMRQNLCDVTEAAKNSPPWPTLYPFRPEPHPPPEANDTERGGAARPTDGGTGQPQEESRSLRNPNLEPDFSRF